MIIRVVYAKCDEPYEVCPNELELVPRAHSLSAS